MTVRIEPMDLARRIGDRLRRGLRRWRARSSGHGPPEAATRAKLETIYSRADPWAMESPREQHRFAVTNRILRRELLGERGAVPALLEIGCGEGHQALHLRSLCEHYTGIDVIEVAVARARARIPDGEFIVGDLRAQPWAFQTARYDIVTACEVLNCFADIPGTLEIMSRVGRACLVTWHQPAAHLLERPLAKLRGVQREIIRHENIMWHVAWWRGSGAPPGVGAKESR
jgi:SAM-dependent methyltransferase